ncbi:MAG TPA: menaquinol-cytochrome c reductase cytochrome b subunit [Acidimicrobiales bacterium]|nr:menaquinol-cytochrome c reductase cytochrome b subunit [Acidimicrobiales bacterium]
MAEIPDHLLKRAAERRAALEASQGGATPAPSPQGDDAAPAQAETPAAASDSPPAATGEDAGKIPAHLLARSQAARAKTAGEGDGGTVATTAAPAATPGAGVAAAPAAAGITGPAGHTQRLLTVVKAGSIQDVKATPTDKVHTWPHLLVVEFVASLAMTAFLLVFSAFVNAPLLGMANINRTPNPSKAPWYFLGLQELLTMFHPMVAGVMIPGVALIGLGYSGYVDKNPSNKPEDRKFAIAMMTIFLMFWGVLVIVGSFFRGEGFNFILPWQQGVHEIFDL